MSRLPLYFTKPTQWLQRFFLYLFLPLSRVFLYPPIPFFGLTLFSCHPLLEQKSTCQVSSPLIIAEAHIVHIDPWATPPAVRCPGLVASPGRRRCLLHRNVLVVIVVVVSGTEEERECLNEYSQGSSVQISYVLTSSCCGHSSLAAAWRLVVAGLEASPAWMASLRRPSACPPPLLRRAAGSKG